MVPVLCGPICITKNFDLLFLNLELCFNDSTVTNDGPLLLLLLSLLVSTTTAAVPVVVALKIPLPIMKKKVGRIMKPSIPSFLLVLIVIVIVTASSLFNVDVDFVDDNEFSSFIILVKATNSSSTSPSSLPSSWSS